MRYLAAVAAVAALAPAAHAADAPYEDARTAAVVAELGFAPDAAPEGKRIAWIRTVRHDVFAEDEPIPTFFNVLHGLTDEDVVARELLLKPGEPYRAERVEETRRLLREMGVFALVRLVPVAIPDHPDEVGLLVYTRDLWSLRLEQSFQFNGGQLDELTLQLTELNLGGRAKRLTGRFNLLPFEYSAGQVFLDRRVLGGDLLFMETADLILNRKTDALEGGQVFLRLDRPLWDLADRWGFSTSLRYDQRVGRQTAGATLLTYDDPRTPAHEAIPRQWDQRLVAAGGAATVQQGRDFISRFSGGFGVVDFAVTDDEGFRPRDLRRIYPFVAYSGFNPTWRTFHDLATYGLAEDVRLGPALSLRLSTPLEAFGSDTTAFDTSVALSQTASFAGDGLWEVAGAAEASAEQGGRLSQLVYLRLRGATPSLSAGRLVARLDTYLRRTRSGTSTALVSLGGDNGLRGYPSQAFVGFGENLARGSAEWRTPPLVWESVHLGGVMFYDAGSVYPDLDRLRLHQSVGVGARLLLPQFNWAVYRLDVGVPLDGTGFMVNLSGGSNQATPMTRDEDLVFESDVAGLPVQPDGPRQILQ